MTTTLRVILIIENGRDFDVLWLAEVANLNSRGLRECAASQLKEVGPIIPGRVQYSTKSRTTEPPNNNAKFVCLCLFWGRVARYTTNEGIHKVILHYLTPPTP
jgi:hypothetical protein